MKEKTPARLKWNLTFKDESQEFYEAEGCDLMIRFQKLSEIFSVIDKEREVGFSKSFDGAKAAARKYLNARGK